MNIVTLQLRRTNAPVHEPAAWFIAGEDPARWLEEIASWELPHDQLALHVVPRSMADRTPIGLLVIPPRGTTLRHNPRAMPLGLLGQRLYLPADSTLTPQVSPQELDKLCPVDICFFHPGIGLIGFERDASLRLWDLLALPVVRDENWNFANPGINPHRRLVSVRMEEKLSWRDLFGGEGDDIGKESPKDLPPREGEPKDSAPRKLWRTVRGSIARAASDMAGQLPQTGQQRTWINDLGDWGRSKLNVLSKELENLRTKEVRRLMDMLEKDPEKGLRHAIPFARFLGRGTAAPGWKLNWHNLHFNLGNLGGGQSMDSWHLPYDMHQWLMNKYRELAVRETNLGRYRRAAYIYAELLGDLHAAAMVLKQGRHFREAAVLFKDHLKLPIEAARCLAEGGLVREAIEIYVQQGLHVDAGDLHALLGEGDEAMAHYRAAVARLKQSANLLLAAELLETKLRAPEEALELLHSAWPQSAQASACLQAEFVLLGKLGLHKRAEALLGQLAEEHTQVRRIGPLTKILAETSARYPDASIRHSAADLARVKIAERIGEADTLECRELVQTLTRLAPEDRLLVRDGNRFLAARKERRVADRQKTPARPLKGPVLATTFQLPKYIQWKVVRTAGRYFFAAGFTKSGVTLVRGIWDGTIQALTWGPMQIESRVLLLEVDPDERHDALLVHRDAPPLKKQLFPAKDTSMHRMSAAGTPEWFSADVRTCAWGPGAIWTWRIMGPQWVVDCHSDDGVQVFSFDVSDLIVDNQFAGEAEPCMAATRHCVGVAYGNRLRVLSRPRIMRNLDFDGCISGLATTPWYARPGLAVMMDRGLSVHWLELDTVESVATDLVRPLATFTGDGTLVAIAGRDARIFDVDTRGVNQIIQFEFPDRDLIAVVKGGEPNEFACFSAEGLVKLFRVQR